MFRKEEEKRSSIGLSVERKSENLGQVAYAFESMHLTFVTALGLTEFEARILRTSKCSCGTPTFLWPWGIGRALAPMPEMASKTEVNIVLNCILNLFRV